MRVVLTRQPQNYIVLIFTHWKLCLADAIRNFKWMKIIQISDYFKCCWLMSRFVFNIIAFLFNVLIKKIYI